MSALRRAEDTAIYAAAQAETLNQALCALSKGLRAGREPAAMLALVDATASEVVAAIAALDGALDTFVAAGGLDEPPEFEPGSWAVDPAGTLRALGVKQGGDSLGEHHDLALQAPDGGEVVVAVDGKRVEPGSRAAGDITELRSQGAGVDHVDSPSVGSVAGVTAPVVGAPGAATPGAGAPTVGAAADSESPSFGALSAVGDLVGDGSPLPSPTSTERSAS